MARGCIACTHTACTGRCCPPPPYQLWKTYKHLYKQLKRMEAAEGDLKRRNEEARRELARNDEARRALLMATSAPSMAAPVGMVEAKCVPV